MQIHENPYLLYFCGHKKYDDSKPPFEPSSMVHFRMRLTMEILGEINELILRKNQPVGSDCHDDDNNNRGTMIADATCAPSNIRFPQDESLLNKRGNGRRRTLIRFMIQRSGGNRVPIVSQRTKRM